MCVCLRMTTCLRFAIFSVQTGLNSLVLLVAHLSSSTSSKRRPGPEMVPLLYMMSECPAHVLAWRSRCYNDYLLETALVRHSSILQVWWCFCRDAVCPHHLVSAAGEWECCGHLPSGQDDQPYASKGLHRHCKIFRLIKFCVFVPRSKKNRPTLNGVLHPESFWSCLFELFVMCFVSVLICWLVLNFCYSTDMLVVICSPDITEGLLVQLQ